MDRKIISIKVPQEGFLNEEKNRDIEPITFADAISLALYEKEELKE